MLWIKKAELTWNFLYYATGRMTVNRDPCQVQRPHRNPERPSFANPWARRLWSRETSGWYVYLTELIQEVQELKTRGIIYISPHTSMCLANMACKWTQLRQLLLYIIEETRLIWGRFQIMEGRHISDEELLQLMGDILYY